MTRLGLYAAQAGIIVNTKMPAQATEKRFSEGGYLLLLELLKIARLPVSTRFNARYDLVSVLGILVAMCKSSQFVTPAIASLARHAAGLDGDGGRARNVPSARWFTGLLSSVEYETMLERAGLMFSKSVEMMVERAMIPASATIAIDLTLYPYLGKLVDKIARGGPSKGGTSMFETYATAAIASLPQLPHVAIKAVYKGDSMADCVEEMLEKCRSLGIRVGMLLLDRGFYSAAVMEMASRLHLRFIMPVPMSVSIRHAVAEFKAGRRKAVSRYTLNAKKGSKGIKYEYTMIIVKKFEVKNGKRLAVYLVFATNMPVRKAWKELHKIPKEYKKRWAIETGYRTVNETRARTKSNSLSARLFLFYFTMTALNVLAMCNHDADTARTRAVLLERARNARDRRAAARARGRGGGGKRRWQRGWRSVVTRDGMFDWMRMIAVETFRLNAAGRADLLARLASHA